MSGKRGFTSSWRSAEHGFVPSWRSAEHGGPFSWRSAEHGFTLIETLVALAVFSLAALALLRLEGATLSSAARLQDRRIGRLVARSVGYGALTDPLPPALGTTAGTSANGGRVWRWTRRVTRVGDGPVLRIEVGVAEADGGPAGALTLFRAVR